MHQEDTSFFIVAAQICSSHGIQGEVACTQVGNLPFILEEGMQVCVIPPQLGFSRFMSVEHIREHKHGILVSLSELTNKEDADKLASNPHSCIMVSKLELERFGYTAEELEALSVEFNYQGYEVYDDEHGFLGVVSEVLSSEQQDLLCVDTKAYGQVYIPCVEAYIKKLEAHRIFVQVPESLLTLNS